MQKRYRDEKGRELFVGTGIGRPPTWMTFWRKPTGSKKRVVAPSLPPRAAEEEAQSDLDAYAAKRGWRPI